MTRSWRGLRCDDCHQRGHSSFSYGPGRDRTCDLGIKSLHKTAEAGCSRLKVPATCTEQCCTEVQRTADGGDKAVLRFVLHRRRRESRSHGRGSGASQTKKKFTEPVALLSTQPADLPLPRTAGRQSFNLLALRARCEQEPTHPSREGQDGPARDYRTLRRFSSRASDARTPAPIPASVPSPDLVRWDTIGSIRLTRSRPVRRGRPHLPSRHGESGAWRLGDLRKRRTPGQVGAWRARRHCARDSRGCG